MGRRQISSGRIVVLSSHTPSLFWFRIDMIHEFQRRGYEVYAVGNEPEDMWKDRFDAADIQYRQIEVSRNGTSFIKDIKTLMSIIRLLKELKPDKIFSFQAKTVIYGCIAAKILGIRGIYPLIAGLGSVYLTDGIKSRLIRCILSIEYRLALRDAKVIFFQNADDIIAYQKHKMVTKKNRIVMIPGSGVNTQQFYPVPIPDKASFLFIGRLIRDKGVIEYLEACREIKARHSEVRCMLVGPYDSNPTAINEKDLQPYLQDGTIEYYGEQTDVKKYIDKCGVFVLPSYREGMPKTVLEAMACGRAVITTDTPGCRETVKDGENGLLIPVKDAEALMLAMEKLILSPELVREMGTKGRIVAEKRFDVRIVNKIICDAMGCTQEVRVCETE